MVTLAQAISGGYLLGLFITAIYLVPLMWDDPGEDWELGDAVAMGLLVLIWPLALGLIAWDAAGMIRDRARHKREQANKDL